MPERIAIVGCGAIGGLYAAHLAQLEDVEVWAYDTSSEHVAAINTHGLRVTGAEELTATVTATSDPAILPDCAFGILATKGTVTEPAIAATAHSFCDGAVCSLQNGIGNEAVIAAHVPRVMRGVALPAARLAGPGVIHMAGPGATWLGPFEDRPATGEQIDRLAGLLSRAGMETHALADARGAQWTKLLFNCSTNPLCALTGLTHGQLCDHPPMRQVVGDLLREGRAVAEALGINLEQDPDELVDTAGQANYLHKPSMLQDVLARRRTEIATLNGGIVAAGRRAGVPTPLNQAMCRVIEGLEHSWTVGSGLAT
jgi:2-dehydropantoate 2-reductase